MSNLIVRKARKDYVCDCCGHVIKAGTEYIDNVVIKYGNVVKHERYHDECPAKSEAECLFKRIIDADGDLIASTPEGNKVHITGIKFGFPNSHEPRALVWEWDGEHTGYLELKDIKGWIDEHGERILSKS